jgi:type IV pilus assembly protein PilB
MLRMDDEKLGKILTDQGLISEKDLARALEEQTRRGMGQKSLGSFLSETGYVTEQGVLKAMGVQYNLPVMDLKGMRVDPSVLKLVPEDMARRFRVLPLYLVEKELTLAVADPTHIYIIDTLANQTRCQIQPVLASERDIIEALDYNYRAASEPQSQVEEAMMASTDLKRLEEAGKEISIIRTVDGIHLRAIQEGASDIHVESGKDKLSIRLRVDGILKEYDSFSPKQQLAIISRIKIMSQLDISERYKPQDGRIKLQVADREIDVRVSTLPTYYGEKVVLRLLDQQKVQLNLDDLGFSPHNLNLLKNMVI